MRGREAIAITAHQDSKPVRRTVGVYTHRPDGARPPRGARVARAVRTGRAVGLLIPRARLDHLGRPDLRIVLGRALLGRPAPAAYDLFDMADDAAALLEALGLANAHVVGVSMGGMIGQTLALRHGARVRSLTSIMSSPGGRRNLLARPSAVGAILAPPGRTEDAFVASSLALAERIHGRGFPFDREEVARQSRRAFARGIHPEGFARQLTASLSHGDRSEALRFVRTPTLVVHGDDDPLIPWRAGAATARAIPNARLEIIAGMGHGLPSALWDRLANSIADHARRARPTPPHGGSTCR
jgi:pimeloyl-ACP methyl ester carboxylesterase